MTQRSGRGMFLMAAVAAGGLALAGAPPETGEDAAYIEEVEKWRQDRETRLKADDGWLTVAGLYWLRDGEHRVGTDPTNDFVLPEGSAPADVGAFELRGKKTRFRPVAGAGATQNGKPVDSPVSLETGSEKDAIAVKALRMWVHLSGDRFAIRLRDLNSSIRKNFTGLRWFPVNESYKATARFVPYDKPKPVETPNILGDIERYESPGYVVFTLGGQELSLQPVSSNDGYFYIFRDLTSGKETYPAARFLRSDVARDGQVVLDFNKAYNPPCVFSPFTTCPLPPPENRLRVRIEAGEQNYHKES